MTEKDYSEIISYYHNSNPLLVQARVGMAKPSTHDLPPLTHIFGKANVHKEGAKESVQTWQVHINSER